MGNSFSRMGLLQKLFVLTLACLSQLALGSPVNKAGDPLLARVQMLSEGMSRVLLECPERVWPGMNWRDPQVVYSDHEKQQAFVWNEFGGKDLFRAIDFSLLPPSMAFGFYANGEWKGRDALAINLAFTGRMPAGPFQRILHSHSPFMKAFIFMFRVNGASPKTKALGQLNTRLIGSLGACGLSY